MAKILVINGPNLNLLGLRESKKYGTICLEDINNLLKKNTKHQVFFYQNNVEGNLVSRIHRAFKEGINFIIINAAAYTHTSIAIRDALLAVSIPFIEVHITNIYSRENYRHGSYLADIAVGIISGFGAYSYLLAILAANNYLKKSEANG
jgi:3-dehydroquinate dehydratase II